MLQLIIKLKAFYHKIPTWLVSKYSITFIILAIWLIFFDKNNLFNQIDLASELKDLKQQENYYSQKTREVEKEQNELLTTPQAIERFAREKYWMKKDNEDIFILVEKE